MAIGTSSLYLHLLRLLFLLGNSSQASSLINCGLSCYLQHVASFHLGHFSFTADLTDLHMRQSLILPELRRESPVRTSVLSPGQKWWRPEEAVAGGLCILRLESRFTGHLICNRVPTASASSHSQPSCQGPECLGGLWAEAELQRLEKDNSQILYLRENQAKLDRQLWDVAWRSFLATFLLMFPAPSLCV